MFERKLKGFVGLLGIAAVALIGPTASATTFRLQPASGAPFLSTGLATWKAMHETSFEVQDGRSVSLTGVDGTWVTHIPVDATNTTWNVRQVTGGGTGTVSTRICSFTSAGVFSNCSSTTSDNNVTRSVSVPSEGTAFAQTFFDSMCRDDCSPITLHTIRAWN